MTEFEEIDGKLVIICDHEWSGWIRSHEDIQVSMCLKCEEKKYLVPRTSYRIEEPKMPMLAKIISVLMFIVIVYMVGVL